MPSLQEDEKLLSPKDTISIILRKIKKTFCSRYFAEVRDKTELLWWQLQLLWCNQTIWYISKFKKNILISFLGEVLTYFFRSNIHNISSSLIWASVKVVKLELMVDRIRCSIPRTFHRKPFINTTQSPTIQISFHSVTFEW